MTKPRPEYELEPFGYDETSSSSRPYTPPPPVPSMLEQAGRSFAPAVLGSLANRDHLGRRIDREKSWSMINPIETAKGIGHMAKGAALDVVRGLTGIHPSDQTSFVGNMGKLAKGIYNNPLAELTNMITAPGGVASLAVPYLPKGLQTLKQPGMRALQSARQTANRLGSRAPNATRILDKAVKNAKASGAFVDAAALSPELRNSFPFGEAWKGGLPVDKAGNVILKRWANSPEHMSKGWKHADEASLKRTSQATSANPSGPAGGLPTSIDKKIAGDFGRGHGKQLSEFRVPHKDFTRAFKDKNAIFGNAAEGEFVLNPEWAQKYHYPIKSNWSPQRPTENILEYKYK